MKKLFARAKQSIGNVEITEESNEFQKMEEQLKDTNQFYKDALAIGTAMKKHEEASIQPLADFGQLLSPSNTNSVSLSNVNINVVSPENVAEEGVRKIAEAEKNLAAKRQLFLSYVNDELINPVNAQLAQIKATKTVRKRMEDARIEYDSVRASDKKTEDEVEKAKKAYETLRTQMTQRMSDIEYQRTTSFVHSLASVVKAQRKYHEDSLKLLTDLDPLLQQVDEQVPKGAEDEEGSIQVELNLLRLQRVPHTIMENVESSVREELLFLEESGRATGNTKEAQLRKILTEKLNSMSG